MTTYAVITRRDSWEDLTSTYTVGGYAEAVITEAALKVTHDCDASSMVLEQIGWALGQYVPCHDNPAPIRWASHEHCVVEVS